MNDIKQNAEKVQTGKNNDNKVKASPNKGCMSKKRYQEILDSVTNIVKNDELIEQIMASIRSALKFDPDCNCYSKEYYEKKKENLHKLRNELGISTYVSTCQKNHYEKKKEQLHKLRDEFGISTYESTGQKKRYEEKKLKKPNTNEIKTTI